MWFKFTWKCDMQYSCELFLLSSSYIDLPYCLFLLSSFALLKDMFLGLEDYPELLRSWQLPMPCNRFRRVLYLQFELFCGFCMVLSGRILFINSLALYRQLIFSTYLMYQTSGTYLFCLGYCTRLSLVVLNYEGDNFRT